MERGREGRKGGAKTAFSFSHFSFQGIKSFPEILNRLTPPSHWLKSTHMTTPDQPLAQGNRTDRINGDQSLFISLLREQHNCPDIRPL